MLSKGRTGTISQAEILTEWQFTCGPQTQYFGNNDAAVPWRGVKALTKSRTQTKSQLEGAPLVLHSGGPLVVNLLLPNPFCSLISASWKWRRFKHLKCLVKSLIREHISLSFYYFYCSKASPSRTAPKDGFDLLHSHFHNNVKPQYPFSILPSFPLYNAESICL